MADFQVRTATEQVADYLRSEIIQGRWSRHLPGGTKLAGELGVGKSTMEAALNLLEAEGLLVSRGTGRQRRINLKNTRSIRGLRIQILLYEETDRKLDYLVETVFKLQLAGHTARFSDKTLTGMGMDLKRVTRFVRSTETDALVVQGASREILEWFATRSQPVYALFGRQSSVNIGGTGTLKSPALAEAVGRLVDLGHRRIVMLTHAERRKPEPGLLEKRFLKTLAQHGLPSGSFNLPDWDDNPRGLQRCLDSLFAITPPTALVISEPQLFLAAQQHLSLRGIVAPRDVSMLCGDYNPVFDWARPTVSHLRWDTRPLVRQVGRWVNQVARGRNVRRQKLIEAEFVEGGTIGKLES